MGYQTSGPLASSWAVFQTPRLRSMGDVSKDTWMRMTWKEQMVVMPEGSNPKARY